jgi:hypothetical protein
MLRSLDRKIDVVVELTYRGLPTGRLFGAHLSGSKRSTALPLAKRKAPVKNIAEPDRRVKRVGRCQGMLYRVVVQFEPDLSEWPVYESRMIPDRGARLLGFKLHHYLIPRYA